MIKLVFIICWIMSFAGAIGIYFISLKNPEKKRENWKKYFTYIGLFILNISVMYFGNNAYLILSSIFLIIGLQEIYKTGIKSSISRSFLVSSIITYLIIAYFFLIFIIEAHIELIVLFYFTVLIFDAFSQISGQLFGTIKITEISPNKTLEGLVGGLSTTLLLLSLLKYHFPEVSFINYLTMITILCLVYFGGDILASFYKRKCNKKDFANILPGMGGFLDRYDGWFSAGLFYFIWNLIF